MANVTIFDLYHQMDSVFDRAAVQVAPSLHPKIDLKLPLHHF
jgi:hypothetical protein